MRIGVTRLLLLLLVLTAAQTAAAQVIVRRGFTRPGSLPNLPPASYQYRLRSPSETAVSHTGVMLRTRTSVREVLEEGPTTFRRQYSDQQVLRNVPGQADRRTERHIEETIVGADPQLGQRFPHLQERVQRLPPPTHEGVTEEPKPGVTRRTLTDNFTVQLPAPEPKRQTVVELYQLDQPRLKIDHCEISQVALQLHDDGHWILSLRADQNRRPDEEAAAEYNPRLYIKRNQFVVRLRCLGDFKNEPSEAGLAAGKPVMAELNPRPFWVENGQPCYLRTGDWNPWVKEHFEEIDRAQIEFFYYTHRPALNPRLRE